MSANTPDLTGSGNPLNSAIVSNNHGVASPGAASNTIVDQPCDASVAIGQVVRLVAGVFIQAQADSVLNARAVGIVIAKTSGTLCTVQFSGITQAIMSGLTAGDKYFLDPSVPGGLTTTVPSGAGEVVLSIGRAMNANQITIQLSTPLVRAS